MKNIVCILPGHILECLWPATHRDEGRLVCKVLRELLVPGRAPPKECVVYLSWQRLCQPFPDDAMHALVAVLRQCARNRIGVSVWLQGGESPLPRRCTHRSRSAYRCKAPG